ncbi:unnamed protein product [Gordionus sp. m RMFG-2023]
MALKLNILAKCSKTKARVSILTLPHSNVDLPAFMPVGTHGTIKGILPEQIDAMGYKLILGNTYHLSLRPGHEIVEKSGGLHKFSNWKHSYLTDSGGFQMVSLSKLAEVTEEGVEFLDPFTSEKSFLSPEQSMKIQNALGADIIMQLDDVIPSISTGPRVEEAMGRSIRWLDRCLKSHENVNYQNLFAIIQGGLDENLREICCKEMVARNVPGYAIGGLSGGEEKDHFWRIVDKCTDLLPFDKPRYSMGVGYALDILICVALGVDMFDCVFPTRTARFGRALVPTGYINLKNSQFADDLSPIDIDCQCFTCSNYSKSYLNRIMCQTPNACHLVSIHNLYYQANLMKEIRGSIMEDKFELYINKFLRTYFTKIQNIPQWVKNALDSLNINYNF